jgi:hypothetical protein
MLSFRSKELDLLKLPELLVLVARAKSALDLTDISRGVDFGADLGVVFLDVIAARNNPAAVFFLCFLFRFFNGMLCMLISLISL